MSSSDYAHHHIKSFLRLDQSRKEVQHVANGADLTAENFQLPTEERTALAFPSLSMNFPILITDTAESIGMRIPNPGMTLKDFQRYIGKEVPLQVLDVERQEELDGWVFQDLVEYFQHKNEKSASTTTQKNPRRPAAQRACAQLNRPLVLNQLSLEFSELKLRQLVDAPRLVRQIDWITLAQDYLARDRTSFTSFSVPKVQYYLLTSAEGAFTDFHVDFGGSSVWYHVYSGSKDFCLFGPEYLDVYEKWISRPDQDSVFFPTLINETPIRLQLKEGQSLIIPSGWIHAVYTPVDSIVFGGNFLHSFSTTTQMEVFEMERRLRIPLRCRLPSFRELHFVVATMYMLHTTPASTTYETNSMKTLYTYLCRWWYECTLASLNEEDTQRIRKVGESAAEIFGFSDVEEFLRKFSSTAEREVGEDDSVDLSRDAEKRVEVAAHSGNLRPEASISHMHDTVLDVLKLPDAQGNSKFRIHLSAPAKLSNGIYPPRKNRQIPRETLLMVDEGSSAQKDVDWEPQSHCCKTRKDRRSPKRPLPASSTLSPLRNGKIKTARSRLLSKILKR